MEKIIIEVTKIDEDTFEVISKTNGETGRAVATTLIDALEASLNGLNELVVSRLRKKADELENAFLTLKEGKKNKP